MAAMEKQLYIKIQHSCVASCECQQEEAGWGLRRGCCKQEQRKKAPQWKTIKLFLYDWSEVVQVATQADKQAP